MTETSTIATTAIPEWQLEHHRLCHFTFSLVAANTANVQLFNKNKYHAMIYDAVENADPKFAKTLHAARRPSIWTFSDFIVTGKLRPATNSNVKGDYVIESGTSIRWRAATIYPDIARCLNQIKVMHLGKLEVGVTRCNAGDATFTAPPERFSAITVKIDTPLLLFNPQTKVYEKITEESLTRWQVAKLSRCGIITNNVTNDLADFIRFKQVPDQPKGRSVILNNQVRRLEGVTGFLTTKVMGDDLTKEHIYNLFQISQFTGMGSNCNLGFGHNTITHIR